jgi:hypothetical protein
MRLHRRGRSPHADRLAVSGNDTPGRLGEVAPTRDYDK